jgi:hypothetical protein
MQEAGRKARFTLGMQQGSRKLHNIRTFFRAFSCICLLLGYKSS